MMQWNSKSGILIHGLVLCFVALWELQVVHNINNETAYGEAYHGCAAPTVITPPSADLLEPGYHHTRCPLLRRNSVLTRLSISSQRTSILSVSQRTFTVSTRCVSYPCISVVHWELIDEITERCRVMLPRRHQRSPRGPQHRKSRCD
jgi:hypothetical protein